MSYVPIHVEPLRLALRYADCVTIKVLMYLCSRADQLGRCYPSVATMCDDLGYDTEPPVYRALSQLERAGYIGYLAKSGRDLVTGQWRPNVYIINPMMLAVRDFEAAWRLWHTAVPDGRHPSPLMLETIKGQEGREYIQKPHTNQQQNQLHEPTTGPTTEPATTTTEFSDAKGQKPEAKSEKRADATEPTKPVDQPRAAQAHSQQRGTRNTPPGSAAPPHVRAAKTVRVLDGYPDPIVEPLAPAQESVATGINRMGIPMPRARGLVKRYGIERCNTAASLAAKRANNPPGFMIWLLRSGLAADDRAGEDRTIGDSYTSGKYAEFVER